MMDKETIERVYDIAGLYKMVGDFECQGVSADITRLIFKHSKRVRVRECNTVLKVSKLFKDADELIRPQFLYIKLDTRNSKGLAALIQALMLESARYRRNHYSTTYFTVKRIINELEPNIERKIAIDCILTDL